MSYVITKRFAREESGGILALFAVIGTALLLVVAFVLDVANWTEHRRHLQVQADAGVLAAASDFAFCFQDPTGSNAAITAVAHQYAGDPTVTSYNRQVDDPNRVTLALNRPNFPPPSGDYDPTWDMVPDDATKPDTVGVQNLPCDARALEIKMRDTDIPSFLQGVLPDEVDFVDTRAKAKVEIRKVTEFEGMLPWAIPEFDPVRLFALYVRELDGAYLGFDEFTKGDPATLNDQPVVVWNSPMATPPIAAGGTGIVIFATRRTAPTLTGSLATICAQPSSACFAGTGATSGLGYLRGFLPIIPPGTAAAPQLLDVQLAVPAGGCAEDSAPYFMFAADCDITVRAQIDFGTGAVDPRDAPTDAVVRLDGDVMTWVPPGPGETVGWFEVDVTVDVGSGRQEPYTITWRTGGGGGPNGQFLNAAHPYASNEESGPIEYFWMANGTTTLGDHTYTISNPLDPSTEPLVSLQVGVRPSLEVNQDVTDPPILLRFGSVSGSRNQAIDCDNGRAMSEEIVTGCFTPYRENPSGDCSAYVPASVLPPATFDPNPKPDCARVLTGDRVSDIRQGLEERLGGAKCTSHPNMWPDSPTDPKPKKGDPRWVVLMVTDLGTFTTSGGGIVPVRKFAGFYVTGWDYHPSQSPGCPSNDGHPLYGNNTDSNPSNNYGHSDDNGDVWGYFVTRVEFVPGGTESTDLCAFNEVGLCTAVLTE